MSPRTSMSKTPRVAYSEYSGAVIRPTTPSAPEDAFIKVEYEYNGDRKIMWVMTSGQYTGVELL